MLFHPPSLLLLVCDPGRAVPCLLGPQESPVHGVASQVTVRARLEHCHVVWLDRVLLCNVLGFLPGSSQMWFLQLEGGGTPG